MYTTYFINAKNKLRYLIYIKTQVTVFVVALLRNGFTDFNEFFCISGRYENRS